MDCPEEVFKAVRAVAAIITAVKEDAGIYPACASLPEIMDRETVRGYPRQQVVEAMRELVRRKEFRGALNVNKVPMLIAIPESLQEPAP